MGRAVLTFLLLTWVVAVLAGCSSVKLRSVSVSPALSSAEALPRVELRKFGGKLVMIEHPDGRVELWTDDEASFDAGAEVTRRAITSAAGAWGLSEWLSTRRAETAVNAAAATDKARLANEAATASQASELQLLEEANRNAEALNAVP